MAERTHYTLEYWHSENYSGEHREWVENIQIPVENKLVKEIQAEAADKIAALEAEVAMEKKRADAHWTALCDKAYQIAALVSMLGENGRKVWDNWKQQGITRVHYSWGPGAAKLTGEERAAVMLEWDQAVKRADAEGNSDETFEEDL